MELADRLMFKSKLNSIRLCLKAHPDNEPNSEFEDRINDCDTMIDFLGNDANFKH